RQPWRILIVRTNRTMRFIFLIDRCAAGANQFVADLLSALPPKADMCSARAHVGFGPIADSCGAATRVTKGKKRTSHHDPYLDRFPSNSEAHSRPALRKPSR